MRMGEILPTGLQLPAETHWTSVEIPKGGAGFYSGLALLEHPCMADLRASDQLCWVVVNTLDLVSRVCCEMFKHVAIRMFWHAAHRRWRRHPAG